ncbi:MULTISPECIES: Arm DNA-binding domain-containing protein [unclassified Sphingopyxis]|uniref:Arm DNA-binding domain-containing protein n=1 Tax=unclassified Sphingopyxis TaxID=2614943 RepID=UPI001E6531D0|nr:MULTISPECIES: Arm DNA-binding domain-containing protein [unclassified Sphingopyxis]
MFHRYSLHLRANRVTAFFQNSSPDLSTRLWNRSRERIGDECIALSDTKVRTLKPRDKLYKVSDDRGLYLEVRPNGSRLWRYRYFLHGKDKRIALGAYPVVGLKDARRKRDEAQRSVEEGVDPVLSRKREKLTAAVKMANSFGDVANEYIMKITKEGRADATLDKARWLLKQLAPIAKLPIADPWKFSPP